MKKLSGKILSVLLVFAMLIPTGAMMVNTSAEDENDGIVEFNGHYYQLFDESKTWYEAKDYCENIGGHLVTITSQEENKFVVSLLKNRGAIIGFSDEESEGNWKWVTNEEVVYINWRSGEPNNQGNEDYALIDSTGGWNDGHLERENWNFICEWDSGADVPGEHFPEDAVEFNGHYYKAFEEKMLWTEAKAYCESLGGHLATITSAEENDFIFSLS